MKKTVSTCILTTIYPMPEHYVIEFFQSLSCQTELDFEVVIINDSYPSLGRIIEKYADFNCIVLEAGESPINNRERLIKFAAQSKYDVIIFSDSDDKLSKNRVEVVKKNLCFNNIVVNDVTTFNSNSILDDYYFSKNIYDGQVVGLSMIKSSNFFGLSNTAMTGFVLDKIKLPFPKGIIALDWYIYSCLLSLDIKAQFTNQCLTYYRQHEENQVGIGLSSNINLMKVLKVRDLHFRSMLDLGLSEYSELFEYNSYLIKKVTNGEKIPVKNKGKINPFWWDLS